MKKILISALLTLSIITSTSCNQQIFDTTFHFDKAILSLPDDSIIEGKVDSWTDFADGDQIQVKMNGITYLVHSSNIVLIND